MSRRSVVAGLMATVGMGGFYAGVLGLASGFSHLADQARADWPYLAAIVAGFGVQIALLVELRGRRAASSAARSVGGAGAGASAVGMVACCAHHLAELVPLVSLTGAAAFLTDWRVSFMLAGIAVNAIGIAVAASRLRDTVTTLREDELCAVA